MLRTVALGVICLAGLGAIAAAKKAVDPGVPIPSRELVMPITAGNKADRLPLAVKQQTLIIPDTVGISHPPPDEEQVAVANFRPEEAVKPQQTEIISRHRHEPHRNKAEQTRAKGSRNKPSPKSLNTEESTQVKQTIECRSDGLDPLLRKLNLSPPCDSGS